MKTRTAVATSILTCIALFQVCPAPPAVLGPIIIAADGAVGGAAIAAGINHSKAKRADDFRHTEERAAEERNERLKSGCDSWPACE